MDYETAVVSYQTDVVAQSMLGWMVSALGSTYLLLLPLAAFVAFLLSLLIVTRGRGPLAGPALLLVVHAPLLIGIFAALQGMLTSYQIIAIAEATPLPSESANVISTALVAPLVAMLLMIPAYATAALGAIVRCLKAPAE